MRSAVDLHIRPTRAVPAISTLQSSVISGVWMVVLLGHQATSSGAEIGIRAFRKEDISVVCPKVHCI